MERNLLGKIIAKFEENDIRIVAAKIKWLSVREASGFYAVHKNRPFFNSLVEYMTSGPSLLMVLEGEDVITRNRTIMGATDPAKADPKTIRKDYGLNIEKNTVHGSDSEETARKEISYFFADHEIVSFEGVL